MGDLFPADKPAPDDDAVTELIAAELDEHGYEDDDEKRWQVARHFAAVLRERYAITEKGQLRQEWTWSWDTGYPPPHEKGYGYPVDSREEAEAEADPYMDIVTRPVSSWRVVDGQEKP